MTYVIFRPAERFYDLNEPYKKWFNKVGKLRKNGKAITFPDKTWVAVVWEEIEPISDFEGALRWELKE